MLLSQQGLVTAGTSKLTESVTVRLGEIYVVWKFWRVKSFTLTHICVLKLTQYSFTKLLVETLYIQHPHWCNSQYLSTFTIAHDTHFRSCRSHQKCVVCDCKCW